MNSITWMDITFIQLANHKTQFWKLCKQQCAHQTLKSLLLLWRRKCECERKSYKNNDSDKRSETFPTFPFSYRFPNGHRAGSRNEITSFGLRLGPGSWKSWCCSKIHISPFSPLHYRPDEEKNKLGWARKPSVPGRGNLAIVARKFKFPYESHEGASLPPF